MTYPMTEGLTPREGGVRLRVLMGPNGTNERDEAMAAVAVMTGQRGPRAFGLPVVNAISYKGSELSVYGIREHPLGHVSLTIKRDSASAVPYITAARLFVDKGIHDAVDEPDRGWDTEHGSYISGADVCERIRRALVPMSLVENGTAPVEISA